MEEHLVFDPVDHYWNQAQQLAEEGDFPSALTAFRKAIRLAGPDHPARWRLQVAMGDTYFDARRYARAMAMWEDVLDDCDLPSDRAWLLWRLSKAFMRRRDLDQAEMLLIEAQALAPRGDHLLKAQIQLQHGELARQRKDYPTARAYLRQAIRQGDKIEGDGNREILVAAYESLFRTYRAEQDLAGALKVLMEIYPRLADAGEAEELITPFTDLGIALVRQNRAKAAEKAFATALLCCPDPTAEVYLLSNYASVLCEVGKYPEAYLYIQKAIAYADIDDPQSPEFLATLYDTAAYISVQRHQLDQARVWVQKALDRLAQMPSSPFPVASIYMNLALIEERAGNLDKALAALNVAFDQNPDSRHLHREIQRIEKLITSGKTKRPAPRRKRRPEA